MILYHFKVYMRGSGNMKDRFTFANDVHEAKNKLEEEEGVRTAHKYIDSYPEQRKGVWGES